MNRLTHALSTADWHKSTYSNTASNCVEHALVEGYHGVRDTKDRDREATLVFGNAAWKAFTQAL